MSFIWMLSETTKIHIRKLIPVDDRSTWSNRATRFCPPLKKIRHQPKKKQSQPNGRMRCYLHCTSVGMQCQDPHRKPPTRKQSREVGEIQSDGINPTTEVTIEIKQFDIGFGGDPCAHLERFMLIRDILPLKLIRGSKSPYQHFSHLKFKHSSLFYSFSRNFSLVHNYRLYWFCSTFEKRFEVFFMNFAEIALICMCTLSKVMPLILYAFLLIIANRNKLVDVR
jgi:hypothetical protein